MQGKEEKSVPGMVTEPHQDYLILKSLQERKEQLCVIRPLIYQQTFVWLEPLYYLVIS